VHWAARDHTQQRQLAHARARAAWALAHITACG
jgi:hypothetical protein